MIIGNANVFVDGKFQKGSVAVENGVITAIGPAGWPCDVDAQGKYLVPGFIDVHTHGAMNEDFSDGKPEGLPAMSKHYAAHGVTSFLATTMTLKEEVLTPAMETIRGFVRPADGAKCAGIHLEGPFLSYAKRGAQAAENLHKPDAEMFHRLNAASGGQVKLVTVAPEEEGAIPFIEEVSKVCTVSIGHTTANYETAMAAYAAGAPTHHLSYGMPSLLHREPGRHCRCPWTAVPPWSSSATACTSTPPSFGLPTACSARSWSSSATLCAARACPTASMSWAASPSR